MDDIKEDPISTLLLYMKMDSVFQANVFDEAEENEDIVTENCEVNAVLRKSSVNEIQISKALEERFASL